MISHSDQHHRTLNYVEVIYLTNGMYTGRKAVHYPPDEALNMYMRTIHKMKSENKRCLVTLREENHVMLKNELI